MARGWILVASIDQKHLPTLSYYHRLSSSLLDKIVANDLDSRTITDQRDALLPKLMSGKLRVVNVQALSEGSP